MNEGWSLEEEKSKIVYWQNIFYATTILSNRHLGDYPLTITCICAHFPSLCVIPAGLHHHHVFPAVLERQAPLLHRHTSQPYSGQQGGRPAVGPRHILHQWQEVLCPRGDSEEQDDQTAPWWHCALRTQVGAVSTLCSFLQRTLGFQILRKDRHLENKYIAIVATTWIIFYQCGTSYLLNVTHHILLVMVI